MNGYGCALQAAACDAADHDRLVAEEEIEGISYPTMRDDVAWRRPRIRGEAGLRPPGVALCGPRTLGAKFEVNAGEAWVDLAGKSVDCCCMFPLW